MYAGSLYTIRCFRVAIQTHLVLFTGISIIMLVALPQWFGSNPLVRSGRKWDESFTIHETILHCTIHCAIL